MDIRFLKYVNEMTSIKEIEMSERKRVKMSTRSVRGFVKKLLKNFLIEDNFEPISNKLLKLK